MKYPLSVIINVYNEAKLLEDCLNSVSWAEEIIITDMNSSDGSAEVYHRYTDRVVMIEWQPIADRVHNIALSRASQDWVLKLDPDERLSPSLAEQVQKIVLAKPVHTAYRLPFMDYMFGKWIKYSGWQGNREIGLIRLFQRGKVEWPEDVHSEAIVSGSVGEIKYNATLNNAVVHINYLSVSQFIEKLNRYTSAEAERLFRLDRPYHWIKLFVHPPREFIRRYFLMQGYRDGMHGLILSLLQSIYTLVAYMKLWELGRKEPGENFYKSQKK